MLRQFARILRAAADPPPTKYHHPAPIDRAMAEKPVSGGFHDVGEISGVPQEELRERVVRIFKPTPSTMQSGTQKYGMWKMEFAPTPDENWTNPLTVRVFRIKFRELTIPS
jgi:hypothetical protein